MSEIVEGVITRKSSDCVFPKNPNFFQKFQKIQKFQSNPKTPKKNQKIPNLVLRIKVLPSLGNINIFHTEIYALIY